MVTSEAHHIPLSWLHVLPAGLPWACFPSTQRLPGAPGLHHTESSQTFRPSSPPVSLTPHTHSSLMSTPSEHIQGPIVSYHFTPISVTSCLSLSQLPEWLPARSPCFCPCLPPLPSDCSQHRSQKSLFKESQTMPLLGFKGLSLSENKGQSHFDCPQDRTWPSYLPHLHFLPLTLSLPGYPHWPYLFFAIRHTHCT